VKYAKYIPGAAAALIILVATYLQIRTPLEEIRRKTLIYGRDVIVNGEISFSADDPSRDGSPHNVHDGNLETAAVIPYPGKPPEGSFILLDAGLSHFPSDGNRILPERNPLHVTIYNGSCTKCTTDEFKKIPRIKTIRFEFLKRRANDPDVEFLFPETKPVQIENFTLHDSPGPFIIPVKIPPPKLSKQYPENVFYYRIKITVLDIHAGTQYNDRVSVAEIEYTDRDADGNLKTWK